MTRASSQKKVPPFKTPYLVKNPETPPARQNRSRVASPTNEGTGSKHASKPGSETLSNSSKRITRTYGKSSCSETPLAGQSTSSVAIPSNKGSGSKRASTTGPNTLSDSSKRPKHTRGKVSLAVPTDRYKKSVKRIVNDGTLEAATVSVDLASEGECDALWSRQRQESGSENSEDPEDEDYNECEDGDLVSEISVENSVDHFGDRSSQNRDLRTGSLSPPIQGSSSPTEVITEVKALRKEVAY